MHYYHGSSTPLTIGTVMTGRGENYEADWNHTDFYDILEKFRPDGFMAHKNAVFMVGEVDDVDMAGGATDWCFEVMPEGNVTCHDMNWSSQISCLLSEEHEPDSDEVMNAAKNYWAGVPHPDENLWEYIASSAVVVRCEPYETFEETTSEHYR